MTVSAEPLLKVEHLCKSFGELAANQDISFDICAGEIHCLLGENGAGKSTLAECLYGFYRPDSGQILIANQPLDLHSPGDAIRAGIGMVHQHFILAQPMSVVENIVVGGSLRAWRLDLKSAAARITDLCRQYEIDLDPWAKVANLSVGQQQWVEILKALYVGVKVLILDEPTAVLTPQESDRLFQILGRMTDQGLAILLITHKLYEVLSVSRRVSILRKGRLIDTVATRGVSRDDLARMMVGREVNFKAAKEPIAAGAVSLDLVDLHARRDNGVPALNGFNLQVRERQIVGLAGVAGNGQKELFDVIVGVRKVTQGQVCLHGQDLTNAAPRRISAEGVASIPPDRIREGLLMDFSVEENLVLGQHHRPMFQRLGVFQQATIKNYAQGAVQDYEIATQSTSQAVKRLSGGNLQKVILARELSQAPRVVLASSPTRGLDVGAMEFVHRKLVALRDAGAAVLLISEDLDEIMNVADVVAVIFKGRMVGCLPMEAATKEAVGLLMAGIVEDES